MYLPTNADKTTKDMNTPDSRYGHDDAFRGRDFVIARLEQEGRNPDSVKDGIVLGSGLGGFVGDHMEQGVTRISLNDVFEHLGLPLSHGGVPGHAQELDIGSLKGEGSSDRLVIAQAGREHPYEGVPVRRSVIWLRIMQLLGVETLLGSNAVGIVTPKTLEIPSLMLVHSDHDATDDNPLVGQNDPKFGPRFPHSGDLYPAESRRLVKAVAARLGILLSEGTLFRTKGPQYESAETIYMLRGILRQMWEEGRRQKGEDRFQGEEVGVTGMSSTFEHLVAQQASPNQNMDVQHPNRAFGRGRAHISVATNYGAGLGPDGSGAFPGHSEVQENSRLVQEHFGRLAKEVILEWRRA